MRSRDPRSVVPPAVVWITRTLEEAGHETWAVGGAVRDVLMGLPAGDWDLATHARPQEVRRIFRRTVPIGVEHGTVGVLARDGVMYELTTFRRDVETDGRHAVIEFADRVEEDLGRRDFTINAIAWHPLDGRLLDPFGGLRDMERGLLRTVGTPEDRFREDYLRILRALRFAGRFDLTVDEGTWSALRALVGELRSLSVERVRDELMKVLGADPRPTRALSLYSDSGALDVLYPELAELRDMRGGGGRGGGAWGLALATVERLPAGRAHLRLAALLRELPAERAAAVLLRLRLSNAQVDEAAHRAGAPRLPEPSAPDADFRRWLSATGAERLPALARLELARAKAEECAGMGSRVDETVASWRRARAVRDAAPPLTVADLALDGRGLIALGLRPGRRFGAILEALLDWVLEDPRRNERAALEKRALELAGEGADG